MCKNGEFFCKFKCVKAYIISWKTWISSKIIAQNVIFLYSTVGGEEENLGRIIKNSDREKSASSRL